MRFLVFVIVAALQTSFGFAGGFEDALSRAERAHEKCQSAWFKSGREAALEELQDAVITMLHQQKPFNDLHDLQYARAVGYFEECARLINPNTFFVPD